MRVFKLYTALFMHVLTIALQDLSAFHKILNLYDISVYVYVVDQLTVLYIVCVYILNGNRNNVLIAIFQPLHIISKPSELYFHNIEP